ncbi:FkbM family methyltransferase [Pseudomonadales bacterium]|nr:FkbM family methyltransferase [Pseudomonadales bacterium]
MLSLKILLRKLLRTLRLNKLLAKVLYPRGYEAKFDEAMLNRIRPGDTVWDVGANVGYYTEKFAIATGEKGAVQAFEPVPDTFDILSNNMSSFQNINFFCYALGKSNESLLMTDSDETGSPTNKILGNDFEHAEISTINIQVRRGDNLVDEKEAMPPNVIKIDVEGHEGDVIEGLSGLLGNNAVHTIAMEIHFALLDERNENHVPKFIVTELEKHSFTVNWTDPSHIVAYR